MKKNINLLVLLIVTIIIVFVVIYLIPKSKEGFQAQFDFKKILLKGQDGSRGEQGNTGPDGPQGEDGPACRNIISYLENRGHLSLGETNQLEELDISHQLELKGNIISKSVNFSKLKITDYKECYPIMIGNNENDADFYIKKGKTDCKMFLKGDLEIDGSLTFKDPQDKNTNIEISKLFYNLAPIGIIVCFNNTLPIPDAWAICNGQSKDGFKTPDLRGKFIKGASTFSDNGDNNDDEFDEEHKTKDGKLKLKHANMPIHNHTLTDDGGHYHTINVDPSGGHKHTFNINGGSNDPSLTSTTTQDDSFVLSASGTSTGTTIETNQETNEHTHAITIASTGDHNHTLQAYGRANPTEIDIMPPYYTLMYIIKYK